MGSTKYISTKFEVTGRVQGVFFRKYTKAKANELELTGWCRNTPRGTVEGEYEYIMKDQSSSSSSSMSMNERHWGSEAFQHWLSNVGSPQSRIDGCNSRFLIVRGSISFV
mmetsp:Transcript_34390/g.63219  ORF Transcript_34390/g.63219 Transcript_34390/m.63219 type:complete len:110 (-) Transcript_34390:323-652(-)